MVSFQIRQLSKNVPFLAYFISTLFMIVFSVHAIHMWPHPWAQASISFACILPALLVLMNNWRKLLRIKKWSIEFKLVLIILVLGILNICFSENRFVTLKGMGLFLMSGVLIFSVSFALLNSWHAQVGFLILCSSSFLIVIVFGFIEFLQKSFVSGDQILLFSSNPIPAGSLIILLSIGPLLLFTWAKSRLRRSFWAVSLFSGMALVILIGQRGPILALIIMVFLWSVINRKKLFFVFAAVMLLVGIGYELRDSNILENEKLLVRMEFYHVALDVVKEKPIFGLGFNSSLSRYIPFDYESKIYPIDSDNLFFEKVAGLNVFDNMALSLFCEAGGLFSIFYLILILYLFRRICFLSRFDKDIKNIAVLLAIVLIGFGVHSMTYDSLKYPHLNWIFHSILGLMARCESLKITTQDQGGKLRTR